MDLPGEPRTAFCGGNCSTGSLRSSGADRQTVQPQATTRGARANGPAVPSCFLGFMYLQTNLILGDQKSSNSGCINDFSITSKSQDGSRNLQLRLHLLTLFITS